MTTASWGALVLETKLNTGPDKNVVDCTYIGYSNFQTLLCIGLVCLKNDVGNTIKYGGYEQYEPSLICILLIFVLFWIVIILAAPLVECNKEEQRSVIRFLWPGSVKTSEI